MNQLLTVAGGIIAVYIILGLIVSQCVEWINTVFNLRGRLLRWGIEEMMAARASGPSTLGSKVVDGIYSHPLIGNLGMKKLPSYVGPRTFTISTIAALRDLQNQPNKQAPPVPQMSADGDALLNDLRSRIDAVFPADDPLRKSLELIIEQTENRYDSVLEALDAWFEAQMDRVTGTFKRYAAYIQIVLALIVVYGLHADTFALITSLSHSAAAQSAISAAQSLGQGGPLAAELQALVSAAVIQPNWQVPWWPRDTQEFIGVVITWFAVLLGAPFWFDILKQIVPVRLSGAKPDGEAAEKGDKQAIPPRINETLVVPRFDVGTGSATGGGPQSSDSVKGEFAVGGTANNGVQTVK